MSDRQKASRTRRRLREMVKRISSTIDLLVAERGPLVKGHFQMHGTRCGKPNCKCVRGELHPTAILVVSEEGTRHNIYIPAIERTELQRKCERYRRFRQGRAEIAKLSAEILRLADVLMDLLIEPYVPQKRRPRGLRKQAGKKAKG